MQHVVLRATRYEETAQLLSLTEFKSYLSMKVILSSLASESVNSALRLVQGYCGLKAKPSTAFNSWPAQPDRLTASVRTAAYHLLCSSITRKLGENHLSIVPKPFSLDAKRKRCHEEKPNETSVISVTCHRCFRRKKDCFRVKRIIVRTEAARCINATDPTGVRSVMNTVRVEAGQQNRSTQIQTGGT